MIVPPTTGEFRDIFAQYSHLYVAKIPPDFLRGLQIDTQKASLGLQIPCLHTTLHIKTRALMSITGNNTNTVSNASIMGKSGYVRAAP